MPVQKLKNEIVANISSNSLNIIMKDAIIESSYLVLVDCKYHTLQEMLVLYIYSQDSNILLYIRLSISNLTVTQ